MVPGSGRENESPQQGQDDQEALTRNLRELLQELRVAQTGVQILTGFLLTVPFSSRFAEMDRLQRVSYLVVLSLAALTTAFVLAPAAFHRVLFRQGLRGWLVDASNLAARIGMMLIALSTSGVLFLMFDVVIGLTPAIVAALMTSLVFFSLWVVTPVAATATRRRDTETRPAP